MVMMRMRRWDGDGDGCGDCGVVGGDNGGGGVGGDGDECSNETNILLFDLEALLGAHQASSQVHQEESLILIQCIGDNKNSFHL